MRSFRQSLLVVSLLGMAVGVPALAQTATPSAYPPACDDSKVSKADRDRAHTVFLSGKQFLEEANYDKAISYFKDAYSIDCSVHGILPIIASAYERKGDKREAIRALEEYQQRAPTAGDHEVVERRIRNLRDQIVQEQPSATTPPSASASVAAPSASQSVEVAPSASSGAAAMPPAPVEEGGSHRSSGPWILAGVGIAALAGGAIAYGIGAGKVSNAENTCGSSHACPGTPAGTSAASDGNTGRTLEQVGLPVASIGLAAAIAGIIWHFVEPPQNGEKGVGANGVRVTPLLAPRAAGISFEGSLQ
jgi:hypothetical protein